MKFFNIMIRSVSILLICINSAVAQEALPKPMDFAGAYILKYAAIPIGQVSVRADEDASHFSMQADAKLLGVARLFSDHESHNKVEGTMKDGDYRHSTREFQTRYTSKDSPDGWRTITLGYADGRLTKEDVQQTHEMSSRSPIPPDEKATAYDTMTMVFALRQAIYQTAMEKRNEVSMEYFDGKRLTRVKAHVYGKVSRDWRGKKTPVLKVGLMRELVAGYTPKEIKRQQDGKMGEIFIFFTTNDAFQPILGEMPTALGVFRAELQ